MPKQFSAFRMVATLVVVCAGAGLLMAAVNEFTREPIAEAKRQEKLAAIARVLGKFANKPDEDAVVVDGVEVYPGRDADGNLVGIAIPVSDAKGYGGAIRLMVGLDASGKVLGVEGLELKETPGLGDAILKAKFLLPLLGQTADSIKWAVKKDGGDVDAVTAATISSRAAVRAIESAFAIFAKTEFAQ